MPATKSPTTEALEVIRDRINAGTTYALPFEVSYTEFIIDPLEEVQTLHVDVCEDTSEQMNDTLDAENRTSHDIFVWVRSKVSGFANETIEPLRLVTHQIFQQLNNYDTSDRRVTVWDCNIVPLQVPLRQTLRQMHMYVAAIQLRVEVLPS